jgi:hypothetical protein
MDFNLSEILKTGWKFVCTVQTSGAVRLPTTGRLYKSTKLYGQTF